MDSRYVLKLKSGGDLRRVNLAKLEMAEVKKCIDRLFPGVENYDLFYTDDEGDRIVVDSDLELQEAATLGAVPANGRKIIRLEIEKNQSTTPNEQQRDEVKDVKKEKAEDVKKEKAEDEPAKNENGKTLSSYIGNGFVEHSVIRETAQMIVEMVGPFEGMLSGLSQMMMGSLMRFSACEGLEDVNWEGLEMMDLGELYGMVKDLVQGVDPVIREELAKLECFQQLCARIREKRVELLARLGKVEEGMKVLKEKGCQAPKWAQLVGLWKEDGDAERVLANAREGGRCGMRRSRCGPMGGMGFGGMGFGGMEQMFQRRCGMGMGMGMGMAGSSMSVGDDDDEALQAALLEAMGFKGESSAEPEREAEKEDTEERRELSDDEKKELDDVFDDCFNKEGEEVKEEEEQEQEQVQEEESEEYVEQLSVLLSMGIEKELAKGFLQKSGGNLEMALEQFFQA